MGKGSFTGPLEQVDSCCYRIPKSYRADMRVDGLIFANARLIDAIRSDQAPDQVVNVATLPGIQSASLAMPDIHWGYGFCIGGVCATDPAEGGVISPGGVGYDINCLTAETEILHRYGYTRPIGDMAQHWEKEQLACLNLTEGTRTQTGVARWFAEKPKKPVYELVTRGGDRVRATADHPMFTPRGMTPLGELNPGDCISVTGFRGVPFASPSDEVLVSEEHVREWVEGNPIKGGHRAEQIAEYLRARQLLPLRRNSPALPVLCKVMGFLFGDGSLHFEKSGKGIASFYGSGTDLDTIASDLDSIGVTMSRVYSRQRQHQIATTYQSYSFERIEEFSKVTSTGFAVLLALLGVPVGKKYQQDYTAPIWLETAPLWQKRLFLAALFGAELSKPQTMTGHGKVLTPPVLSMNKRLGYVPSGRAFLQTLSRWLSEFGVETQDIPEREEQVNADSTRSIRLRLILTSKATSLLNLWERVGFEYNSSRSELAALAVQYVKYQEAVRRLRTRVAEEIAAATGEERSPSYLQKQYSSLGINRRFIERALYSPSESAQRMPSDFPTFAEFQKQYRAGPGMVWDEIVSIDPVPEVVPLVYDFTVDHEDHNFVANGFVVSNCGVRLVKSNLFLDEIKPHLRELVKGLFHTVPAGVGRTGRYKFNAKETRELMAQGVSYTIGRGLGVPRDLGHIEANGRIEDSDPEEVTDHAVKRGAEQCGTLGSNLRCRGGGGLRTGAEPNLRDDPQRQPGPGLPGLRRRSGCVSQCPRQIRDSPSGSATSLCAGRFS
jgi:tRNA-splicing ligase RtcB